MWAPLLLVLAAVLSLGGTCTPPAPRVVVYDPYEGVDWDRDVRCKAQFHDHVDVFENRVQAYDDAGYCAVAFMTYSGLPGQTGAWTELHWPPELWFDPAFLASLQSIRLILPDAEQGGWGHVTSPFLRTYLECYYDASSPSYNPACASAPTPRQPYHYSNPVQLVDLIHDHGGLAALAHPIWVTSPLDALPVDMMEVCSSYVEYAEWLCSGGGSCNPSYSGGAGRMIANYDRKLVSAPRTWSLCVNDWHGPFATWDPPGPAWISDSGYQVVLVPHVDMPTFEQRVREGAMFAVQDRGVPKGNAPYVTRISRAPGGVVIEASGYERVDWIQEGTVVATGPFVVLSALQPGALRAEIHGFDGSVVFTQPWELR